MSWEVELARDAKKELARLPAALQKRVARVLLLLEDEPFPRGCQKLKNRDGWRVRVGNYRILYSQTRERNKLWSERSRTGGRFIANSAPIEEIRRF